MADNVNLNPGTGGSTVRTVDRSGVETQVVQLDVGNATESLLLRGQQTVALSIPVTLPSDQTVPVTGPITDTQLRASDVPVSGDFYQTTQPVSDVSSEEWFRRILVELRTISQLLQVGLSIKDEPIDIRNDLINSVK